MSGPAARLKQIANALVDGVSNLTHGESNEGANPDFKNEHRHRFQPALPAGLKVNHTPLNPVSFLLRSATIRPDRTAVIHPARNVSWTYSEW